MLKHLAVVGFLIVLVEATVLSRLSAAQASRPVEPLQRGRLTVWIVAGALPDPAKVPALDYATYHEQTAGSFGQTAGSTGQTSGSYGGSSGGFGTSAGNVGRTAGSVGQTAGSFGKDVGEIGQTAGSYGQSAGEPIGRGPKPAVPQEISLTAEGERTVAGWREATERLGHAFPALKLKVSTVSGAELQARLAGAEGSEASPDLLVGRGLAAGAAGAALREAALTTLGAESPIPRRAEGARLEPPGEPLALRRAPHPEQARAFLFWWREVELCRDCNGRGLEPAAEAPSAVAQRAVNTLLSGGSLGTDADPAMAQVTGELARRLTFSLPARSAMGDVALQTEVRDGVANGRLAAVHLRVIASSPSAFGILHPAVVLRRSPEGRWRVLQVSADLHGDSADPVTELAGLMRGTEARMKPVAGVTLAAPLDGDTRAGVPELWWDDPGDARLLAVEWQSRSEAAWSDTHLFFAPDSGPRLQVRLAAPFLTAGGDYRWRVWAVGESGVLALSPWRRLTVLGN